MERGLFRLWLVGSVIWVAIALWAFQSMAYSLSDPPVLAEIFGIPAAIGLFTVALVWAFKGFAR